ncbi:Putative HAD-superfamily hydrolase YfnB [Mycobacteroides abscessus subsp. bolletii]|nr:Putative HAD-superfamily hydrolase YfnB [Mycobacteroides abscessus subsp. bolletii]
MRYKAYLFDVQGTLLDFFEPVSRAVAEHSPDVDAAAFTRAWRADYFARVSNLTQSAGHWTRVQDLYAAGFADVCQTFGLPCPDTATAEDVASSWQRLVPWPDVPAGLAALRMRAVVATLSNTDMATMVNLFKRLDISWDAIFTAEIFGRFKPDPSVYRRALRYLGVEPREAAMVAAHPTTCGPHASSAWVRSSSPGRMNTATRPWLTPIPMKNSISESPLSGSSPNGIRAVAPTRPARPPARCRRG